MKCVQHSVNPEIRRVSDEEALNLVIHKGYHYVGKEAWKKQKKEKKDE